MKSDKSSSELEYLKRMGDNQKDLLGNLFGDLFGGSSAGRKDTAERPDGKDRTQKQKPQNAQKKTPEKAVKPVTEKEAIENAQAVLSDARKMVKEDALLREAEIHNAKEQKAPEPETDPVEDHYSQN